MARPFAVRDAADRADLADRRPLVTALTCSNIGSFAIHTTNLPVARTLRSESFTPTLVNCTIGGSTQETVKKECGARLSTPSAERVDTQAIGRGTTTDVRIL